MSTSITINDLDPHTLDRLQAEANRRGINISQVAHDLLRQAMQSAPAIIPPPDGVFHELDRLAGTWTEADAEAFRAATADFERVDEELWK